MSIDNIFKCCKKNYIITGVSGIMLGAYGSYYGLSSFLGPVYTAPIEVPPTEPSPANISPPIDQPVDVTVPLSEPKTVGGTISAAAAVGAVALIGGLAVITYGASRIITSRESFETIDILQQNLLRTRIGDQQMVIKNLQAQLKNIQENPPQPQIIDNSQVIENLQSRIRQLENIPPPPQVEDQSQIIENLRAQLKNLQENPPPQPKREDFEKIENKVDEEDIKKMQEENLRLREDIRQLLDKIDNAKQDKNLAGFNFFGGVKTVHFVKPEVKISGSFEIIEEEEKKERALDLKARQEIIIATNQVLAKAESNGLAIIKEKLFDEYTRNIDSLGEGRKFDGTTEIALNKKAIIDFFLKAGFKKEVTIKQLLTEDINLSQQNMALSLARTAYTDLNDFIYYGAKTLAGTPYVKIEPGEILYRIAEMQMIDLPLNKIGYMNFPKVTVLLDISATKNFVYRLVYQFMNFIIPIFARLTAVGLEQFDPELARMMYIVANNTHRGSGGLKIVTVPKFGGIGFFGQFKKWDLPAVYKSYKEDKLLEDVQIIKENLAKEGLIKGDWENMMQVPRIKEEFEHVYGVLMDMMDKRDAYVDFIKIYNEIYKNIHPNEYSKAIKGL